MYCHVYLVILWHPVNAISLKRIGIHNMDTRDSSPSVALWYVKRLGSVQTEGYANVSRLHRCGCWFCTFALS